MAFWRSTFPPFWRLFRVRFLPVLTIEFPFTRGSKRFPPRGRLYFFQKVPLVAPFNAAFFNPSSFFSWPCDSRVRRLIFRILSLASSEGLFQRDSPTVPEEGSSVANSSEDFSDVLNSGEGNFWKLDLFCAALGNKRFRLDPVLKENLSFFTTCWCLGELFDSRLNRCLRYVRGCSSFYTFLNLRYISQKLMCGLYR